MPLEPWVSNNIASISLSENRWNQVKTVGKDGNTFVIRADRARTGSAPDNLQCRKHVLT